LIEINDGGAAQAAPAAWAAIRRASSLALPGRDSIFRKHGGKWIWPNLDGPTERPVDDDDDQQFRKNHYRE
jgi:hypothetical protein